MIAALYPSTLSGEVQAVASKSFAHRILIAAAVSDKPTTVKGRLTGKDIEATIGCLRALGAGITATEDGIKVDPIKYVSEGGILDCGESGSALRFMLPLVCALGARCTLIGSERLAERPLSALIDALTAKGGVIEGGRLPLGCNGKLMGGDYVIPADVSSQYVTGLLLALPLLGKDCRLILNGKTVSAPYIEVTLGVLKDFGIEIARIPNGFYIKGGQKYLGKGEVTAEGDWSNAAFFLAGGALSGEVSVKGLNLQSLQGDKAIADILTKMGADIQIDGDTVRVKESRLSGIASDVGDIPDLVPILAVAAMRAEGQTVFRGVERLRDKESDRLAAVIETVNLLGGKATYERGALTVSKGDAPREGDVALSSYNDHRMAMSAAIAALGHKGRILLDGCECVSKSYPQFFIDYNKLGGKSDVI